MMSLVMATLRFVLKRAWYRRAILLPTVLGLLGVIAPLAGVSLFSAAANYVSLQAAIHTPGPALSHNLEIRIDSGTADAGQYQHFSASLTDQIDTTLGTDLLNTPPLRTGVTEDLNLYPAGSSHFYVSHGMLVSTTPLTTADLWFSSSMDSTRLRLTQGRFPSSKILNFGRTSQGPAYDVEAIIAPEWAQYLHLKLNDVLEAVGPTLMGDPDQQNHTHFKPYLRLHIVGFFEPRSLQDPAWFDDLNPFTLPNSTDTMVPVAPIWVSESVFESQALSGVDSASYIWFYYLNLPAITPDNAPTVVSDLTQVKTNFVLPPYLFIEGAPDVLSGLDTTLKSFLGHQFYTNVVTLVVIVPGVALLLLYLGIAAFALSEQSREELALMQSRGASHWQMLALSLSEAALLCLGALVIAPFLAGGLTYLLMRFSFFGQLAGQTPLSLALPTLPAYRTAGLATLLCFGVLLIPAIRVTQINLLSVKRRASRPRLLSLPLRLGPGLLLAALGLFGYFEIQQRGSFYLQGLQARKPSVDWVAATSPTLLLVGIAGLSLLLLPPVLALLDRLAQRLPGVVAGLASRTLARQSGRYSRLIFLLTITISLGIFAGLCYGTLNTSLDERAAFQAGADLRLVEGAYYTPDLARQAAPLQDHLRLLPGVTDGMEALRDSAPQVGATIGGHTEPHAMMLGVDSTRFARIADWRPDFADTSLDTLMQMIRTAPIEENALPAIVSDQFLSQTMYHLGDDVFMVLDTETGTFFQFHIIGTFHYFPSIAAGLPAIVCDLNRLLSLLNQSSTTPITPNEVWLKLAPNAPQYTAMQAQEALSGHSQNQRGIVDVQQAFDRAALAASLHNEPLQSVIFGTLTVDFLIAALLSIVGLALLLYLIARQRTFEFGVLRVMGLSLRQLAGALGWEEVVLFILALLLGIPLGVWIATIVLPGLALDENGQPLLPPVTFQLNVPQALQEGAIISGCLLIGLVFTALIFRRLRVHEVLRLGEE